MRRWIVFIAAAVLASAVIVLLASAARDPTPEERFVESVCAVTLPSAQELLEIIDDAADTRAAPGHDEGWLRLYGPAYRGAETARKYAAAITKIAAPDTEAGRLAAGILASNAGSAVQVIAEQERHIRKLPRNITLLQSIRGLNRVEFALAQAWAFISSVGFMAAETGMLEHFEKADSCKELDTLGHDKE